MVDASAKHLGHLVAMMDVPRAAMSSYVILDVAQTTADFLGLSYDFGSFCAKQEPQIDILECRSAVVVGSSRAWSLRTVSE
jgi:hypothetical protein